MKEIRKCITCKKKLKGQQRKFCSEKCSDKHRWKTKKYKDYRKEYQKRDKWKKYSIKYHREYHNKEKWKKYNREYKREYQKTKKWKRYIKKYQKEYYKRNK